jgi:hypothetical protein
MFAKFYLPVFIYFIFYLKYSCQAKNPARYPEYGPYQLSGRISGIRLLDYPDIRPAGYPAKTEKTASGASQLKSHEKVLVIDTVSLLSELDQTLFEKSDQDLTQ